MAETYYLSRQSIIEKSEIRIREILEDREDKMKAAVEKAQKKREDLEAKHQERLYQIRMRYQDTVQEAVRKNDAVAVVAAMRRRDRELRDEKHQHELEQKGLEEDLKDEQRTIVDDTEKRIRREREQRAQRLEELEADYERRRVKEQDHLDQILALMDVAYLEQYDSIKDAKDIETALLMLKWRQQEEDMIRSYERQEQALIDHYVRERAEIGKQMGFEGAEIDRLVRDNGAIAAAATYDAVMEIGYAAMEAMRLSAKELTAIYGGASWSSGGAGGSRRRYSRAEGGIDVVNQPTTFLAGERGPEIAAFIPLSGSMNVSHNFSRLPIDINGVPGGMNTQQIQSLVWAAMTELATTLAASRMR